MNLRTSALLLGVVATLAALWWFTAGGPGRPGASGGFGGSGVSGVSGGEPLFENAPLAVRVEREGRGLVLQREGGYWTQVAPEWFRLSEEAGQEVARVLAGAVVQESFVAGEGGPSLEEAALVDPDVAVEVVGAQGQTRVLLGESTPGGRSFALVEESPLEQLRGRVVVIPGGLHAFAYGRRGADWFEKKVPLPPMTAVASMSLRGRGESVAVGLVREGGGWLLDDDGAPLRPEAAEVLTRLTEGLPVRDHVTGSAASAGLGVFGLRPPTAEWTLREAGGEETRLLVGRSGGLGDDAVYALVEREQGQSLLRSPVLRLPPTVLPLREGRASLADPRVFPVAAGDARVLVVVGRDGRRVAVESEGGVARVAAGELAADPQRLLGAVLGLTGERRIRPPERVYAEADTPGGPAEPEPDAAPEPAPPPRGFRGTLTLEHGLTGRIEAQVIRRRGDWSLRLLTGPERVEYLLDEPSEDVFEAHVVPLLVDAPAGP